MLPDTKKQPWVLFDTIVADSLLLGDDRPGIGLAHGSSNPAVTRKGELLFFTASGRNKSNNPELTNQDVGGQMSVGMEVWGVYLLFGFPTLVPVQNTGFDFDLLPGVAPTIKLAEAIINFGQIVLSVGQEAQLELPVERVGAGGGIRTTSNLALNNAQNSDQQAANFLRLPEPIFFERTQVLSGKISLDPAVHELIGSVAAPGVGQPLEPYEYAYLKDETVKIVKLPQLPYLLRLGLLGNRVRKTQYGALPAGQTA